MTDMPATAVRNWARRVVDDGGSDLSPLALVRSVAVSVEAAVGCDAVDATHPAPPGGWANPWLIGAVHEQAVSASDRQARGAWYTPRPVVEGLVALATADDVAPRFAVDPMCGGGAFLLAVLDRYVELGIAPTDALGRVAGLDLDAGAVAVTRLSIELWARHHGVEVDGADLDVSVGDAMADDGDRWPTGRLVVGNPPFASPLRSGAIPESAAAYRELRADVLGPYCDLAAIHLLRAVSACGSGSTVAMIQPQSVLAGRDTAGLRRHLDETAPVHALWAARESVFDAGVRTCAVVARLGFAPPEKVALAAGPSVDHRGWSAPTGWSGLAATALGRPGLPERLAGTASDMAVQPVDRLGALADATAGFRDEYYGLLAACHEWTGDPADAPNRLTTVGMVDPLASRWGVTECRFGGRRWTRPVIDVDALEGKVARWTEGRLQPKVVLATQSRLLEPLLDGDGSVVPATPLVAVHGDTDDLPLITAVLLAPPVVAWAWTRWLGTALAVDALKLAAGQVSELPLPPDRRAWRRAAALVAERSVAGASVADGLALSTEVAAIMNEAYGADREVLDWWLDRSTGARRSVTDSRAAGSAR